MKNINVFGRLLVVGVLVLLCCIEIDAQVVTRVFNTKSDLQDAMPLMLILDEDIVVETPIVDVQEVLDSDLRLKREFPRIGISKDLNINLTDGQFIERGPVSMWSLTVESEMAKSMNLKFTNSKIPEKAVMYLYNDETRFLVGPISNENFRDGVFISDYINGDKISILIVADILGNSSLKNNKELALNISGFDHGVVAFRTGDPDFNGSEDCNINVACPEAEGWACEIKSVCKIIHSSIGSATGALINSDACIPRAFILTAEHAVTNYPIDEFLFRFNYQSSECNPNTENQMSEWIVYTGAHVKASLETMDFALLELFEKVTTGMSYAGWDRMPQNPHTSTYIHHPSGDVKKFTYDAGVSWPFEGFYHFVLTPGISGDFGTLEKGSSGGPKFNSNRKIVGQVSAGTPHRILCTTDTSMNEDGRLDRAWTGDGTPLTSLRYWLGGEGNPTSMDCRAHPGIVGAEFLCTNEMYFLESDYQYIGDVNWSVSPANAVIVSSGQGETFILTQASGFRGKITITVEVQVENCELFIFERDVWVGKPRIPEIQATMNTCESEIIFHDLSGNQILSDWDYNWFVHTPNSHLIVGTNPIQVKTSFNEGDLICVSMKVANPCGEEETELICFIAPSCQKGTVIVEPTTTYDCDEKFQCPDGYFCQDGNCIPEDDESCETNGDCPVGFICSNGECVSRECTSDLQCPEGYYCSDGVCTRNDNYECEVNGDCPPNHLCKKGRCVPVPTRLSDEFESELTVWPNPTSDQLTIDGIDFETESILNLSIVNAAGMSFMKINKEQLIKSEHINVEKLSGGIYFLTITYKDGSSTTRKFVKQ